MKPIFPNVSAAVATAMAMDRPTPQCQATRATAYANDTADTDKQCVHSARYVHDGRYLCTRHAGTLALAILVKEYNDGKR